MIEIIEEKQSQNTVWHDYVKQIGEVEQNRRICVEESVFAYLQNLEKSFFDYPGVFIMYGRKKIQESIETWKVSGVIEVEVRENKFLLTEADWFKINRQASQIYPGEAVLGWGMIRDEDPDEDIDQIEKCFRKYFREDQNLFFNGNCLSEIEDFYILENGRLTIQKGFFVCKDEHNGMRRYVYEKTRRNDLAKDERELFVEEIGNDRATRRFKETLQERQEEIHRKKITSFLYVTCCFLVGVVAVIGVTLLQNYEKMETMEVALQNMSGQLDQTVKINEELVDSIEKESAERVGREQFQKREQIAIEKSSLTDEQGIQKTISENKILEEQQNGEGDIHAKEDMQQINSYVTYVVQKGDTLANICLSRYGNTDQIKHICEINQIADQNTILYGEKILLP